MEYGWQILDTKFTGVESGGPSCSAFIKVARTKTAKNRFKRKGICGLNTDIIAENEFFHSEIEVLNFEILCRKVN